MTASWRRSAETNRWIVLALACVGEFMVILDVSIVNVAIPSIQKDLGVSESNLQWVLNSYALLFGGFLLLGGRAGDLLGRKRLFLLGLFIFTAASLMDGLAWNEGVLIGSRAVQGLGGALISPAALAIVSTTFTEEKERANALSVWTVIAIGGAAVGLVLGGVVTEYFSWPWIFFINVPVGIAAFSFSLRLLPESRSAPAHRAYDVAGAVAVTGGLSVLVYAIVGAESAGWGSAKTLGCFGLAAALLGAFVWIELRTTEPLVRLSIFRIRSLLTANLAMFLMAAGMFGMFFFNSIYFQRVLGYGPLKTGMAFLPFTAGIVLSSEFAGRFGPRIGIRAVTAAGMVLGTASLVLLTRLPEHGSYTVDVLPATLVAGIGMGAVFVPLTMIATTGLAEAEQGLASGLFYTSQQIGSALGLAVLSTIAASATSSLRGTPAHALVVGFHWAYAAGAGIMAASLVVLIALLRRRDVIAIEQSPVAVA